MHQQLPNGLRSNIAQTFIVPRGWSLLILVIPWLFSCATSRLTFLAFREISQIHSHEILYRHSWFPEVESWWLWWPPGFSSNTTNRSNFSPILRNITTSTTWLDTNFWTDIYGSQRLNPNGLCWSPYFSSTATIYKVFSKMSLLSIVLSAIIF